MSVRRISPIGQISIYFWKCFRVFFAEKQWRIFLSSILIVSLVCLATSDEMFKDITATRQGCFSLVCACIWIGLFNSIQSIVRERIIIKREHRTGLNIASYILAHVLYEAYLCAVETFIVLTATLFHNESHIPAEGLVLSSTMDLYITFFLVTFTSDMLAIIISCSVRNETTAMTVMPFVLMIQLIMSGLLFKLSGITEKLSYLTISRWGLDALIAISNTNVDVKSGYDAMELTGSDPSAGNLLHLWMILLTFSLLYIVISIFVLGQVDRDKR